MASEQWRLTRGGEVLAILHPDGRSLVPEPDGHFTIEAASTTTPAFEPVRPLFEREVQLLDVDDEPENSEWTDIWETLKEPGLFVESADGKSDSTSSGFTSRTVGHGGGRCTVVR